jgi:hypothetical protein
MARKSKLLDETNPAHLKNVAIGTFLSVLVFLGSFIVGDASIYLVNGSSALTAGPVSQQEGCGPNCQRGYPNDPQPVRQSDNRWPGPFDGFWSGGKFYANADYNRDGKVDSAERDRWNATHKPGTNEPTSQGGGGGPTKSPQSGTQPKAGASFTDEFGCLSATGCD